MTRRRWLILGALLLLLTIGGEFLIRPWNSSKGSVQIVNQGESTINDLVVTYGHTRVRVGQLAAGRSTNVWFTPAGKGTLGLEFHQKGNPMNGFLVEDFDPTENLANGLRLMLVVKEDRVERFMDDEQVSSTPWKSLTDVVTGWFQPEDPRLQ
jgi:hypothetical protein